MMLVIELWYFRRILNWWWILSLLVRSVLASRVLLCSIDCVIMDFFVKSYQCMFISCWIEMIELQLMNMCFWGHAVMYIVMLVKYVCVISILKAYVMLWWNMDWWYCLYEHDVGYWYWWFWYVVPCLERIHLMDSILKSLSWSLIVHCWIAEGSRNIICFQQHYYYWVTLFEL